MSEITIVTAFFDIGRKNFEIISRDNATYISHFECWARINNKLIVYTQPQFKDTILSIRKKFNQDNNTVIITLNNIDDIDNDILRQYEKIATGGALEHYKLLKGTISANKPRYDYLMVLKYWFLYDAAKKGLIEDFAAWLDFGYGHGTFFANPEEFDFKWSWDFERKINLFVCREPDEVPMYEVIRCSLNYIMGFTVVSPAELCESLWKQVREALIMMTSLGFIDDDQTVLLQAYRNHKEDYCIIKSDWFMPLVQFGGGHLTLTKGIEKENNNQIKPENEHGIKRLIYKHKLERKGIYWIVDRCRNLKRKFAKDPLKDATQKLAQDCATRTYDRVFQLYYQDRRG